MITRLVYWWRRIRGRCYGCGQGPPRSRDRVFCQACFDAMVEEFRRIGSRPVR